MIVGVLVVAVTLVIGFALLSSGSASAANYECGQQVVPQQGATVASPMVMAEQGRTHVATGTKVEYLNCPPTSGSHFSAAGVAPLPPGYYGPDAPYAPGNWIHNLEHGFVVVLYRCADGQCPSEADVSEMKRFAAETPATERASACNQRNRVVVARFDQMATPYAFLAWDRLLLQETFDRAAATDFAKTWMDVTGPEAAC
jgi:hypothetical protein